MRINADFSKRAAVHFDKNEWVGGKAAVLEQDGYRFDMGPTILTVPQVLYRVFEEAGRDIKDYLDLHRLDPQWRCCSCSIPDPTAKVRSLGESVVGIAIVPGMSDPLSAPLSLPVDCRVLLASSEDKRIEGKARKE